MAWAVAGAVANRPDRQRLLLSAIAGPARPADIEPLWRRTRRLRLIAVATAVTATITAAVALAAGGDVHDLVSGSTLIDRVDLWRIAFRGLPEHFVLGGGPDLYQVTFNEHAGPAFAGISSDEPHNPWEPTYHRQRALAGLGRAAVLAPDDPRRDVLVEDARHPLLVALDRFPQDTIATGALDLADQLDAIGRAIDAG